MDDPDKTVDAEPRGEVVVRPLAQGDYSELVEVERRHYAISGQIAKGGMGRVLEARDLRLGRQVAIKELLPGHRDAARRFEREARITARLQHPSIIHVYEAGVWPGGEPFYAMPKVAGVSLDAAVAERATLAERLGLLTNVLAVTDALAYAHTEHVIHRDLKPSNVLVGEFGQTVVIDWGLAKDLDVESDPMESVAMRIHHGPAETTADGAVVGTPAYMSPEQARGGSVDRRTDVYALGALLYKVLCGHAPFHATTGTRIVERVKTETPISVDVREPGVPRELVAIVAKAMARDPGARYADAGELAQDLKRFETGQLVAAHRYTPRQLVVRWVRRNRIAVVAALVVAMIGIYSVRQIVDQKHDADTQRASADSERQELLEEKGRSELLASHPGRALAYLLEVAKDSPHGGAFPFMLADALRPFEAQLAVLPETDAQTTVVVAASVDGTIATAGHRIRLWTRDGDLVRDLGATIAIRALAFDPDGRRLLAAGSDGSVRVWSRDGVLVAQLTKPSPVDDAAFDATGTHVVSAHADGRMYVWDIASRHATPLACQVGAVASVRFSHDGTRVLAAGTDQAACIEDVNTGAIVRLRGHRGALTSARWSGDDQVVLTASVDGSARVWNARLGKLVALPLQGDGRAITVAELSSDDQLVVTAGQDGVGHVWQMPSVPDVIPEGWVPSSPTLVTRLIGHGDGITRAAFGMSDTRIVTAGSDNLVKVWDARSGAAIATFEHVDVATVAFAGDRVVSGGRDGSARIWSVVEPPRVEVGSAVHALAISKTGVVAIGTDDSKITLRGGTVLYDHQARVLALAFTPDGARLVSGGEDEDVYIWHVAEATTREAAIDRGADALPVRALAVSSDDALVAIGTSRDVTLWSLASQRQLASYPNAGDALAFSPDGMSLVAGGADGPLVVCDLFGGIRRSMDIGPIDALAFAPDGVTLVVAGQSKLRTYRFALARLAPDPVAKIASPTGKVNAMAFSRDGAYVFTASDDGARIWEQATGRQIGTRGARQPASALALDADGDTLWLGDEHTAVAWDVRAERRPVAALERFGTRDAYKFQDDAAVLKK